MGKKISGLTAALLLLLFSCGNENNPASVLSDARDTGLPYFRVTEVSEYAGYNNPKIPRLGKAYGGTVSHHALASDYIHGWFQALKKNQNVKTSIVISPDHFDNTDQYIALSKKSWISGNGEIKADINIINAILKAYDLKEEHEIFRKEHGIRVLVPYIIKYFPESRIVPIVQKEHQFRKHKMEKLIGIINNIYSEDCFVLVSTDFSHYQDIAGTKENDIDSEYYLYNQWKNNTQPPVCDNNAGMYILNKLNCRKNCKNEIHILSHTDSWQISGRQPDSITSYFFTLYFK